MQQRNDEAILCMIAQTGLLHRNEPFSEWAASQRQSSNSGWQGTLSDAWQTRNKTNSLSVEICT
jgi:hypothetical protein